MKKLRMTALLLAVLMCLALASCASSREVRANRLAERVVATVGDVDILYEELYYLVMNQMEKQRELHGENAYDDPAEREALNAFVAENLYNRSHALIAIGKQYGVEIEKGSIADAVQEDMDDILSETFSGDRDQYIESLGVDYLTDHYVRNYIAVERYLATEIIVAMLENGEIDSSDETATRIINSDEMIRTVQVFLSKEDPDNTRELAESVRAGIAGRSTPEGRYDAMREAIGGKYNDDFADTLGEGYYFLRGEMDATYEEAAFALADYDVSPVTETSNGYYIIMRLPKNAEYLEENFLTLKEKAYILQLNLKVDAYYAANKAEMTRFGRSLDYCDLPELVADGGELFYVWLIVGGVLVGLLATGMIFYFIKRREATAPTRAGKAKKKQTK